MKKILVVEDDLALSTGLCFELDTEGYLSITPNEYKLLRILTENSGQILTRQVLLERLWDSGGNFIDDHTLTVTMNRLRAKIENSSHTYIQTVRGMGYIWKGNAQ